jgi:methylenetetrahydrofolate reductase (NADPH)
MGINVPIIPGLKPITNKKQLTILPNIFYVDIPTDLSAAMLAATTDEACEQVGTEWLIQQSKELKAAGVPVLHYYTLGKPKVVKDVGKIYSNSLRNGNKTRRNGFCFIYLL